MFLRSQRRRTINKVHEYVSRVSLGGRLFRLLGNRLPLMVMSAKKKTGGTRSRGLGLLKKRSGGGPWESCSCQSSSVHWTQGDRRACFTSWSFSACRGLENRVEVVKALTEHDAARCLAAGYRHVTFLLALEIFLQSTSSWDVTFVWWVIRWQFWTTVEFRRS